MMAEVMMDRRSGHSPVNSPRLVTEPDVKPAWKLLDAIFSELLSKPTTLLTRQTLFIRLVMLVVARRVRSRNALFRSIAHR